MRLYLAVVLLAVAAARPNKAVEPLWTQNCGRSRYPDAGGSSYIVGGRSARKGEFPYQVSLVTARTLSHFCGGVILDNQWILTAAHCVEDDTARDVKVVVAEHARRGSNPERKTLVVDRIIMHEQYDETGEIENDIALLHLPQRLTFTDYIQPVCAAKAGRTYDGVRCVASGWGAARDGGSSTLDLRYVNKPVISLAECRRRLSDLKIFDSNLCAGGERGKDTCQGDSGGPIACKENGRFYVVGLTSWGTGRCGDGSPSAYTRVNYFLSWIERNRALYSI